MNSLFAQGIPDLAGNSGWAGAGLLGLVLCWLLLRHLPEKDRQTQAMIDMHLRTEKEQRTEFTAALAAQTREFREMLDSVPRCQYHPVSGVHHG